jgi:hypothetical protein
MIPITLLTLAAIYLLIRELVRWRHDAQTWRTLETRLDAALVRQPDLMLPDELEALMHERWPGD